MEEKDQTISFRVTLKERHRLEEEARQAGLSLTDHVRATLLSPASGNRTSNLEALVKYAIYKVEEVHGALYSIAETQGKTQRFLSAEELDKISDLVHAETLEYAAAFPDNFATAQAEIAALSKQREA